jgi:hypothetical protein
MNAKKFLNVRVCLTMTAVALCGALVLTASCASDSNNNGGSNGSGGGSCTNPPADGVCFGAGQATGGGNLSNVNGYGWVALGSADSVSSPVCDNTANGGGASETITQAKPCPEAGGKSVWTNPEQGLCISGTIPVVTGGDYTGNWGLQIGMNITKDAGGTLGKSYKNITFNYGSGVSPATSEIRGEIHVANDPNLDASHSNYCAVIQPGKPVLLSAFNTECWTGGAGKPMPDSAVANIDKVGVQISSDINSKYDVSNFCWTGFTFAQ